MYHNQKILLRDRKKISLQKIKCMVDREFLVREIVHRNIE